jgi:hypothetical protein
MQRSILTAQNAIWWLTLRGNEREPALPLVSVVTWRSPVSTRRSVELTGA